MPDLDVNSNLINKRMINVTLYLKNYFVIEEWYPYHFRRCAVICSLLINFLLCEEYIGRAFFTPPCNIIYSTSSRLKTIGDEVELGSLYNDILYKWPCRNN